MLTQQKIMTAEELSALPDAPTRRELIEGELREMPPASYEHGRHAMKAGVALFNHVIANNLGEVCAAETGFLVSTAPDTVRAPDAAYVAADRNLQFSARRGYFPGPPDLAIEVISPNDAFSEVHEKALGWLAAGTRMVILLDPAQRAAVAYRSPDDIRHHGSEATLDASDVVPGWSVAVAELFA